MSSSSPYLSLLEANDVRLWVGVAHGCGHQEALPKASVGSPRRLGASGPGLCQGWEETLYEIMVSYGHIHICTIDTSITEIYTYVSNRSLYIYIHMYIEGQWPVILSYFVRNYGPRWGLAAYCFGQLGFPHRH